MVMPNHKPPTPSGLGQPVSIPTLSSSDSVPPHNNFTRSDVGFFGVSPTQPLHPDEDDILATDHLVAPFRQLRDMAERGTPEAMSEHNLDPLAELGEAETRELYQQFFVNAHDYVLVHDPKIDTLEALRAHPMSLAAICAIGAKARGRDERKAADLAQELVQKTVFERRVSGQRGS